MIELYVQYTTYIWVEEILYLWIEVVLLVRDAYSTAENKKEAQSEFHCFLFKVKLCCDTAGGWCSPFL